MRNTLLSVVALVGGCAVGSPFGTLHSSGGGGGQGNERTETEATADDSAPAGEDGASGKLACVHDNAGVDFASAAAIGKGMHRGCVESRAKADVYAITAPSNVGGTLYQFQMVADAQICPELYNQDRGHVAAGCVTDGHELRFWAAVAANTTIYLKLERTLGEKSPYTLNVDQRLLDDPDESNNSWKHATPLAFNQPHTALMQSVLNDKAVEHDYYQVKVASTGDYEIVVEPNADELQTDVVITDVDHREVESLHAKNEGATLRETVRLKAGTYYLHVDGGESVHAADLELTSTEPSSNFKSHYSISVSAEGKHAGKKSRISRR